jgi:hypothetical protein
MWVFVYMCGKVQGASARDLCRRSVLVQEFSGVCKRPVPVQEFNGLCKRPVPVQEFSGLVACGYASMSLSLDVWDLMLRYRLSDGRSSYRTRLWCNWSGRSQWCCSRIWRGPREACQMYSAAWESGVPLCLLDQASGVFCLCEVLAEEPEAADSFHCTLVDVD